MQTLVSIIIPTYNRESIILNTLKNIEDQTYKNWECIIVDDHSTDNTKNIIQKLAKKDNRFRYVVNKRTKGAQGARNTGIINANANWIAFNDSDDDWMPDKLEKQMQIIEQKNYDPFLVVHGNCLVNDHEKNETRKWDLPLVEGKQAYATLLKSASPVFPSIVTSKKALEAVGLLDEKISSYQEWDTSIKLSTKCEFVHIQEPLFVYHLHKGETISKDVKKDISGYQYIRLKYAQDYIKYFGKDVFLNSVFDNIQRAVNYNFWELAIDLLKEIKSFIPTRQYYFLFFCFRFQLDPNTKLDRVYRILRLVKINKKQKQ